MTLFDAKDKTKSKSGAESEPGAESESDAYPDRDSQPHAESNADSCSAWIERGPFASGMVVIV